MKKEWVNPLVHYNPGLGDGGDDSWQGGGSGQSTPDPQTSWTYDEWREIYADFPNILNYDGTGESGTYDDYAAWYRAMFNTDPPVNP